MFEDTQVRTIPLVDIWMSATALQACEPEKLLFSAVCIGIEGQEYGYEYSMVRQGSELCTEEVSRVSENAEYVPILFVLSRDTLAIPWYASMY